MNKLNKNLKRNKTKKIKKLFATFLLIPTLLIPSFVSAAAPSLIDLKVNNIKIAEKQNTLNKKIEEAQEIKSKKNINSQDKNPIFSPWAAEELNQAQFMGLYPAKNFFDGRDFTKAATLDDAKTCYKLAKEKIEAKGLETGGDFSFKDLSRAEILNSISKLLGDEKFEIKNLRAAKIFLGIPKRQIAHLPH